jgi:D-glycero-alpha-D-manno-heptose-7-phosphate kinase
MIVSRAPVRFSLGGGGTDLPAYASRFGGFVVSAAIDKYVYVCCNRRFYRDIRLAYSKTEIVPNVAAIEHPIFREALGLLGIDASVELVSIADLPANSGLGSSSSFTVALLNALHAYKREFVSSRQLAEEACHIEIDRLGEPVGRQDQFIAAFGGVTAFTFETDGKVVAEPVAARDEVLAELEQCLVIVYSGIERPARVVLAEQQRRVGELEADVVDRMHGIKAIGYEVRDLLLRGDLDRYGELLHDHWEKKRRLTSNMTDAHLDEIYESARRAGAIGGKLMGAGGGGFFMFYVRPAERRRFVESMIARDLRILRFRFDDAGARIVANVHG